MKYTKMRGIDDYKIHCFHGKAKVILVCQNRFSDIGMSESFFDTDWNYLELSRSGKTTTRLIEKPCCLSEMIEIAETLSNKIPFTRVDFYQVDSRPYFGEITLYPASGFEKFIPDMWDEKLGSYIELT